MLHRPAVPALSCLILLVVASPVVQAYAFEKISVPSLRVGGPLDSTPPFTQWADTRVVTQFDFDAAGGVADPEGWTTHDRTDVEGVNNAWFHVDDFSGLAGYAPLAGAQSMWCGLRPGDPAAVDWGSAPGYGNLWVQDLVSRVFTFGVTESEVQLEYALAHDLEPSFDYADVEYLAHDATWRPLATFTGVGSASDLWVVPVDSLAVAGTEASVRFRFRLYSDRAYSDEDGGYDSQGGLIVDDLVVRTPGALLASEDFEGEAVGAGQSDDGGWIATPATPFGDYAGLVDAGAQVQSGAVFNATHAWGFFAGSPETYSCGGYPGQAAVPLRRGASPAFNERIWNEVRSPWFGIGLDENGRAIGPQLDELRLQSEVYMDLPVAQGVYFYERVRFRVGGVPTTWQGEGFAYASESADWGRRIRAFPIPDGATEAQVALGVIDITGAACHSHAPLFDNVSIGRGFTSEVVTATGDSGFGTLRQAILAANADPDTTLIRFDLPGTSPHRLEPFSAYDPLTEAVIVDGYTQKGSSPNSAGSFAPTDAVIAIEVDGLNTFGASGLTLQGGGTVRGLSIGNFSIGVEASSGVARLVGNFVGLDASGAARPNDIGIRVASPGSEVGSTVAADRNLVGSNTGAGIRVEATATVRGNVVGVDPAGVEPRSNGGAGIEVYGGAASGTEVGGPVAAAANAVFYSAAGGVIVVGDGVTDPQGVTIRRNRLLGNFPGIDLGGDGPTANDPGDVDDGPNELQNSPVMLSVLASTIEAELQSAPNTSYVLDFYTNDFSCGAGDVSTWIGSESTTTDGSGYSLFSEALTTLPPGVWVSATATDPAGNTSELAACVRALNTPSGQQVSVSVPDESGSVRAQLEFGEVLDGGNTYVSTLTDVPQPIPGSYVVGDLLAFDLTTTANYSSAEGVTVCLRYDDAELTIPESALRMIHYDDADPDFWVDITTTHDAVGNVICGQTSSLSPFAIVAPGPTGIGGAPGRPDRFALLGARPNPFNPSTRIRFAVPDAGARVTIAIHDTAGRRVRTLSSRRWPSGRHTLTWNGRDDAGRGVASGVYHVRMESGAFAASQKIVLLK